jgi:hypothetical protein
MTSAAKIDVEFTQKLPYELDGGARGSAKRLKVRAQKHAVAVCVPEERVS